MSTTPASVSEAAARAAHEANRAYCLALGDTSQPAWDEDRLAQAVSPPKKQR
jgi:hypothetical protein